MAFYFSKVKSRRTLANRHTAVIGAALLCIASPVFGTVQLASNIADLSFDELANIQIISVSKKPERLADAAASVFVITAEDIRRSGATSLPNALRLAPNLHVAQASATGYAISARGSNGSNSSAPNKLLVLIDGRSVYSPLFSGVFWDVQDVMLEDVERIEVISGPGGTLWGVNAVNGVINVITRSAKETVGALATAGTGSNGSEAAFRYGGVLDNGGNYRVYGKSFDRSHTWKGDGSAVNDAWRKSQVGFRADWNRPNDRLMVQGNIYNGSSGQPAPGAIAISGTDLALGDISVSGVNLTAHWTHLLEGGSSMSLQAYYDRTKRAVPPTFSETLDIVDVQFQHSLQPIGMHSITWGANYRYGMDSVANSTHFAFLPANVNQTWSSLFAQDEMALDKDLRLTLGLRVERNDYTGNEFLPNARLAWKAAADHLLWTAASRTVRAPSRLDRDAYVPGNPPFLLDGGRNARSEVANVYEIGYRGQPAPKLTWSVTAFHTVYDHLRTQELDNIVAPTFLIFGSEMEGRASGIEMWGTYQASPEWRLSAGFTALKERFRLKPNSTDIAAPNATGKDPAHTWQLRSTLKITEKQELDLSVRHVAALNFPAVPAYTAFDARFSWQLQPNLELSVTGQNLFGRHAEYGTVGTRTEFRPGVFVKLLWRG